MGKNPVSVKDQVIAWIAFFSLIAMGFIHIRTQINEIDHKVATLTEQVRQLDEHCCSEYGLESGGDYEELDLMYAGNGNVDGL
jgi:hypothetical protein